MGRGLRSPGVGERISSPSEPTSSTDVWPFAYSSRLVPVRDSQRDSWIDVERVDDAPREIKVGLGRPFVGEDPSDESGPFDIEDV